MPATTDWTAAPPASPAGIAPWPARLERFESVGSTNDVVMGWLRDGAPEVCVAIAEEQSAGRGRQGRTWTAPPGAALLLSIGFRPTWLAPEHVWRLGAVTAMAMATAAEHVAGLPEGTIRLKWPNDLVVAAGLGNGAGGSRDHATHKLAGLLGETDGIGTADPKAVIGIGVNVDWPRSAFPADLAPTMTSLSELAGGRSVGREALEAAFLAGLDVGIAKLRAGRFDGAVWQDRQLTNGLPVRLEWPDGSSETVTAVNVDPGSGALLVRSIDGTGPIRPVLAGEIRHLRLDGAA